MVVLVVFKLAESRSIVWRSNEEEGGPKSPLLAAHDVYALPFHGDSNGYVSGLSSFFHPLSFSF